MSTQKIATVHTVYASDDILADIGWDGVLLYVAIDHDDPDDGVLFAHLSEVVVQDWCEQEGYLPVPSSETFAYFGPQAGWRRA